MKTEEEYYKCEFCKNGVLVLKVENGGIFSYDMYPPMFLHICNKCGATKVMSDYEDSQNTK